MIIFRTQNKMNWGLCRIIRKGLGFIIVVHRFLQTQKFSNFDKAEHWILIVNRYWWETSPVVGYVGSSKKTVAVVGNDFFRVACCRFYMIVTDSYLLYLDNSSFFGWSYNDSYFLEIFPFLGTWCKFHNFFVFRSFAQSKLSRQTVAFSGYLVLLN